MKLRKIIYFIFVLLIMFIVSCGKEENNEIKAKNIKEIVSDVNEIIVELGVRVDFEFTVTVVYEDETTKDFLLQDENYENDNVYIHINCSLGEKDLKLNFTDDYGTVCTYVLKVIVEEESYKADLKNEINSYKNDLEYSEESSNKIKEFKLSCINGINSSVNKEEAKEFVEFYKSLIDNIKTILEEEKEILISEVLEKINLLEEEMKEFINYDDTEIKNSIEEIKNQLASDTSSEEIEQVKLVVSSLSSSFHGVKQKVLKNEEKLNEIANILSILSSDASTKDEVNKITEKLKDDYTNAINEVSMELLDKLDDFEIVLEDGILKWRNDKYDEYIILADMSEVAGTKITSAGLNEEGRLIFNFSDGSSIDCGFIYDASSNEKLNEVLDTVDEMKETLEELKSTVDMLEFVVLDVSDNVRKMSDYFADMGFNFDEGSSLDLITAIITLLPKQLEKMGYDFKMEDAEEYLKNAKKIQADNEVLMEMVEELRSKTTTIYDIINGEGTILEKEILIKEEINNVSKFLSAMGASEEEAAVIDEFLNSLKQENDENLKQNIKKYFTVLYDENNYKLDEEKLGKYYTECLEYSEKTGYDSLAKINLISQKLDEILLNINGSLTPIVLESIITLEKEALELDSNLEIVKSFLASKLELEGSSLGISEEDIVIFKNRILTTNSVTSAIEIFELVY